MKPGCHLLKGKTPMDVGLKLLFLTLFSAITFLAPAQTTNISGIVNTYHKVLSIVPGNEAVKLDNTTGLSYGNLVVIIQMKGATIDISNSSSYGSITGMNNAGNYELATICEVSNDTVYFFHTLLNSYTVADQVQLVKFGEYYSANVTGTLTAANWDNSTGKGGVLAIRAEATITLNASISADSAGYKGGAFLLHGSSCSNFFPANGWIYDGNNTGSNGTGAFKGEGIAVYPANGDGGRGSPANAGGGGNNHNNGGGGGSNLSTGGNGGGNYTTVSGACSGAYVGVGGKALNSSSGTRIFMGGGGGAGHANNTSLAYGGGNGGGIIIILADDIIGNGYKISSNGQGATVSQSDGASGGGGAGTIIMDIQNSYSGSLTIEAVGGKGGDVNNQNITNRCYGTGGGGSGGVLYFNGTLPAITTSIAGGAAGTPLSVSGCGSPVLGTAGTGGSIITGYSYVTSTTPSGSCDNPLPVKLIYFNARLVSERKVEFEWSIANPGEALEFTVQKLTAQGTWMKINSINADEFQQNYKAYDNSPAIGENIYRLQLKGKDNSIVYSGQRRVQVKTNNLFTIFPNPTSNRITISGRFRQETYLNLTDISGKLLFRKKLISTQFMQEIDLQGLPAGIYIVEIEGVSEKLIIR